MARKRRHARPADPMAIARRRAAERLAEHDPATWGVNEDALGLAANAAVEARSGAGGGAPHPPPPENLPPTLFPRCLSP
ncbi:MAG: hypothetical protein ACR2F8_12360, partial [Caulobacteraceae bacterium]